MNENNQEKKDSQENDNFKVLKEIEAEEAISLGRERLKVGKGSNLIIGTLNIIVNPLKKRSQKHYQNSRFHLIADIILVGLVIFLIGLLFVIRNMDGKDSLEIASYIENKKAVSGRTEVFVLEYANSSQEPLRQAKAAVRLPDNFILQRVWPENAYNYENNTFVLGDLSPGANGEIKIAGVVLGEIGQQQTMGFYFNYEVKGRNFTSLSALHYNIEDSVLDFSFAMPDFVYKSAEFEAELILKNKSENNLKDIFIDLTPKELKIKKAQEEKISLTDNRLELAEIKAGEEIGLKLICATDKENDFTYLIEAGIKIKEKEYKQRTYKKEIKVKQANFQVRLIEDKKYIGLDSLNKFTISYENKDDLPVKGLKFNIYPESGFDLKSIGLNNGQEKYSLADNIIFVASDIEPKTKGGLAVWLDLKAINPAVNQTARVNVEAVYELEEFPMKTKIFSPKLKIASDLKIGAQARYYTDEGDQLGVGPFPPVVGLPTRYWIFFEAENFGNDIKDFSVSAELGERARWTGVKNLFVGELDYNQNQNEVEWRISEVKAEKGYYRAGFEIEIIPEENDAGRALELIKNISYSGFDLFIEDNLSGRLETRYIDLNNF